LASNPAQYSEPIPVPVSNTAAPGKQRKYPTVSSAAAAASTAAVTTNITSSNQTKSNSYADPHPPPTLVLTDDDVIYFIREFFFSKSIPGGVRVGLSRAMVEKVTKLIVT
jgi:hypothetical protein